MNYSRKMIVMTMAGLLLIQACQSPSEEKESTLTLLSEEELIKRGAYLTTIGACHDCHSPKVMTELGPEPDTTRLFSGHPVNEQIATIPNNQDWILFSSNLTAFVGPWGVSYAANLTPDDTGIKHWTFDQFKTALRKGKYKGLEGGRDLLPPMPWTMYRNFTDDDMLAIFTYLKSLPPINNLVPAPVAPGSMQVLAVKK